MGLHRKDPESLRERITGPQTRVHIREDPSTIPGVDLPRRRFWPVATALAGLLTLAAGIPLWLRLPAGPADDYPTGAVEPVATATGLPSPSPAVPAKDGSRPAATRIVSVPGPTSRVTITKQGKPGPTVYRTL